MRAGCGSYVVTMYKGSRLHKEVNKKKEKKKEIEDKLKLN